MSSKRSAFVLGVIAVLSTSALFAFQSGGRGGGERAASTTLTVGEKEQIALTYNTLKLGKNTLDRMKGSEQMRAGWAARLPQLLEGTLKNDVELKCGETAIPAGSHGVSFAMTAEGGWEFLLKDGEKETKLPLTAAASAVEYGFMNMNIVSTGADSIRFQFGYGMISASLDATIAAPAEK